MREEWNIAAVHGGDDMAKKKAKARKKSGAAASAKARPAKKRSRKAAASAPRKRTASKVKATKAVGGRAPAGATAAELATKQRDISVSEFFAKNRHLLGFDNPAKALLTTVKEGVDNALDACEEGGVLPDIRVEIS